MKNYFRGKIITYDDILNDLEKLFNLTDICVINEEKLHVLKYLRNLNDEEKKEFICKNIVGFNKKLNDGGYGMNSLANVFCYIGFIGLVENGFSLIKELDISEMALLSSYVFKFITHPDYEENIDLPFLTEKSILAAIVYKTPNNLKNQCHILSLVRKKFIENSKVNISDNENTSFDLSGIMRTTKGVAL